MDSSRINYCYDFVFYTLLDEQEVVMALKKKYFGANIDFALNMIREEIDKGAKVFAVNVHSVGIEYRIYPLSIENIMGKHFTFSYFKEVDGKMKLREIKLTESEYKAIEAVVQEYWKAQGSRWQDRGLY